MPPVGVDAFLVTASVLGNPSSETSPRVGLAFVDSEDAEPRWLEAAPLSPAALGVLAAELLESPPGMPDLRPLAVCEALGCGFRFRCHPDAEAKKRVNMARLEPSDAQ